ncbi:PepSY domain-containing protein [Priestia filamentosa]|uniref:Uncharacterized protein n=1 Tax=Priestia filamentosa TaxID=1402861 RepID=A0A1X7FV28_9BACI|nr:PepSY domain-containing protein [Priestia filamentosa]AVD54435.1 hypothetical protein CKF96_02675 [Priestia filamentosa]AWG44130.1 hypothetical protein BEH_24160 [Priestia filamentosa]MDT3765612.1 PepSY domain-containing protein [Priestia filamentosa]OXS66184.1 hypothetical protein B1B01_19575 [Priestia filamentosa]RJS65525.1 hypothetical protein CJ485_12490 [Priestia filamentosa]
MRKSLIVLLSLLLIVILGFGTYRTIASKDEKHYSQHDVKGLITEKYRGKIQSVEHIGESYVAQFQNESGIYKAIINSEDGEVTDLVQIKSSGKTSLTETEIKDIALKQATGDISNIKLHEDKKNPYYDIEVTGKEKKVEMKIAKMDGELLSKEEYKLETNETEQEGKGSEKSSIINKKKAEEIALTKFKGKVKETDLGEEDGLLQYEIEIEDSSGQEAEVYINAYTGTIIRFELDKDD